jgi:pantothenate kinase
MESILGILEAVTKVSLNLIKDMAMEKCFGQMEISTGDGGKMDNSMVKANSLLSRKG